ncbi:MAG TPA: hypothetical protein VKG05_03845 [Steroidobacteraceae bacterium]|nr:hypothetical protein [Steroidobacteraceae bacterium]
MTLRNQASHLFLVAALCIGGTAAAVDRESGLVLGDSDPFAWE